MNDLTITLTRQEAVNLKLLLNAAVSHGISSTQFPHLQASALMWPILVKIEQAEQPQQPKE